MCELRKDPYSRSCDTLRVLGGIPNSMPLKITEHLPFIPSLHCRLFMHWSDVFLLRQGGSEDL